MKFNIKYIFIFVFLFSCTQDMKIIKEQINLSQPSTHPYYSSKGFALIYEDSIFEKKIVNEKLNNNQNYVLHSFLEKNTLVNISNPFNSKWVNAKVRKASKYPSIYNIVITKKMADDLDLDINNPYVEIFKIKKNLKFIAKKASIFEEEKNVADKAPITSININNLSVSEPETEVKKKKSLYIIHIADFYFVESAETVKNRFKKEANLVNIKIKQISKNKFKVYSGPYDSFYSMKESYLSLNELGFEELDITRTSK